MIQVKNVYFKHNGSEKPLISGIRPPSKYATEPKEGGENWNLITNTHFINCEFHPNCDIYKFRNCLFHDCSGVRYLNLENCEVR